MTIPKDLLISISGIRGIYPSGLSRDVCQGFVDAYCKTLTPGSIVLSTDTRKSGQDLKQGALRALAVNNYNILDAGVISLPTTALAIVDTKSVGGICLTASHNPIEYNGIKFLNENGEYISQKQLDEIIALVAKSDNLSNPQDANITDIHESSIVSHIEKVNQNIVEGKKLTIALDAVNGAGSEIIVRLLKKLNCKVIEIATDPEKPFLRIPEPTTENLKWTQDQLRNKQFDIAFVVDPDADRLSIIDENNILLSEELTLPLVLLEKLNSVSSGTIVLNMSTSRIIEDMVKDKDIRVVRSAVGEKNVVEKIKAENAFFGGEGNGGVIDPQIHNNRDSLVGIVNIINLLRRENKSLSQIISELPKYSIVKEKIEIEDKSKINSILPRIRKEFVNEKINLEDGVRVEFKNSWVHIRSSNTEPIVRIIAEAKRQEKAQELVNKVKNFF